MPTTIMENSTILPLNLSTCLEFLAQHNATSLPTSTERVGVDQLPTVGEVWGWGLLSVIGTSILAALGVLILPLAKKSPVYEHVLTGLIGLGVGTLSGAAVFQLLPAAFLIVQLERYLPKAGVLLLGIYLFFIFDRLVKIFLKLKKRRKAKRKLLKHIGTGDSEAQPCLEHTNGHLCKADGEKKELTALTANSMPSKLNQRLEVDDKHQPHHGCGHEHELELELELQQNKGIVATVAWMIIFGDGLHKFVDGLSVGAAFVTSLLAGFSISVAILCEELPHILGDAAILLNAGMTWKKAFVINLLLGAPCLAGFVVGVLVGELMHASAYIFALAGGMFLYISLAIIVPEMNESVENAMDNNMKAAVQVFTLQGFGIAIGLLFMYLISHYGNYIQF